MVDWFRVFIGTATAINTVANVSTNAKINESMQMQRDAATIEMLRNIAKDIIFSTRRTVDKLVPIVEERPFFCHVVAELLSIRLEEYGINSELFSDFQEKTYLADTEDTIVNIKRSTTRLLSKDQLLDSDKAVQIVLNDGKLEAYITHLGNIEQLKTNKQKLNDLEQQRQEIVLIDKKGKIGKQKVIFGVVIFLGVMLTCIFPLLLSFMSNFLRDNLGDTFADIYNLVVCFLPTIGIITTVVGLIFISQKSKDRKSIDEKINILKNKFESIKKSLSTKEEIAEFVALFGDLTYDGAVQLNKENDDFIRRATSEEEFEDFFKISSS